MSARFRPFVAIDGAGTPLVLVHGSWTDHRSWQCVVPQLAQDHLVVTYDRRGHSRSPWSGPVTRRQDEDDLAQVVDELGLGPVHLVGNSYGASIALGLAARRSDLVRSVVAHEPPLLGAAVPGTSLGLLSDDLVPVLDLVVRDVEAGRDEAAARRFVEDLALGPGAWQLLPATIRDAMVANATTFAGMLQDPAWDAVPRVPSHVPMLLTRGTVSPTWLVLLADELASTAYSHAARHTFDGAGHTPHLTHPDAFVEAVVGFVRSSAGARQGVRS